MVENESDVRRVERLSGSLGLALLEKLAKSVIRLPRVDCLPVRMPDRLHPAFERLRIELAFDHVPERTHRGSCVELIGTVRVKYRVIEPLAEVYLAHLFLSDREIRAPDAQQVGTHRERSISEVRVLEAEAIGDKLPGNRLIDFRHDGLDSYLGVGHIAVVRQCTLARDRCCKCLNDRARVESPVTIGEESPQFPTKGTKEVAALRHSIAKYGVQIVGQQFSSPRRRCALKVVDELERQISSLRYLSNCVAMEDMRECARSS